MYGLIKVLLLTLSVVLMTGCNGKKTTEITVLGEDSSNLQAMSELKDSYERDNDIKIIFKPNTFEDAFSKANNDFAYKTALYDIVLQYNFSLSSYVRNSFVYSIDQLTEDFPSALKSFENDLYKNAWQEVGFYYKNFRKPSEGIAKVGYPFAANTMILVCNKEMFENKDNQKEYHKKYNEPLVYPTKWSQYKNMAEFFTNKQKNTYGVALQGANNGWLYYEFVNFLYGMDGKVFEKQRGWEGSENTEIKLLSEKSVQATKFYLSLKNFNAGDYKTIDANEQIKLLKKGNVAMGIVWSDYLFNFTYDLNKEIDKRFEFVPIPGNKSALAGGSFYINKDSKHPKEAVKYIMSLMQPKNQIELAKKGLCSPLKSVYENTEIQKIPYSNALKSSLDRGVYMFEAGLESDIVQQAITTYMQQAWAGKISAEKALSQIYNEIKNKRREIYNKKR